MFGCIFKQVEKIASRNCCGGGGGGGVLDDSWSVGVGGKPWVSRGSVRGGSPSRQEIAGEGTLGLTDTRTRNRTQV